MSTFFSLFNGLMLQKIRSRLEKFMLQAESTEVTRAHIPKEAIEQNVKTGIPPQSPLSLPSSDEKEN